MKIRILQQSRGDDEIRIDVAFHQNTRTLEDIAEEVRRKYAAQFHYRLEEYLLLVAIVNADTLERLHTIYSDN